MNETGTPRPMGGRVCVVTGATSGIGYETATGLAGLGATVIGVGRSRERCEAARAAIRSACGADVVFEVADLASGSEVRSLAGRIRGLTDRVDVLVNNAGAFTARRRVGPDGIEVQLAVNVLAPFLLTHELADLLGAAPEARVITLSSGSHFGARLRHLEQSRRGRYRGLGTYGATKAACILWSFELARQLGPGSTIRTYAVDPGLVNTDMGWKDASLLVRLVWLFRRRRGLSPREGARTSVYLASDPGVGSATGGYWKECTPVASSQLCREPGVAVALWKRWEELTGIGAGGYALPIRARAGVSRAPAVVGRPSASLAPSLSRGGAASSCGVDAS
jgi:NAD(P)-dependent dehydrogenase (short-subunit alcohol dehydrogenase family)